MEEGHSCVLFTAALAMITLPRESLGIGWIGKEARTLGLFHVGTGHISC